MKHIFTKCLLILSLLLSQNVIADLVAKKTMHLKTNLDQPSDIAIREGGQTYVLDGVNHRVVVYTHKGEIDFIFGSEITLKRPMGISISDKQVYIADSGHHRITVFNLRGEFLRAIPLAGKRPPEPVALTVDRDIISWADRANHQVCRTDKRTGNTVLCWGKRGKAKGEFQFPFQLKFDSDKYLHVVDVLNGRVQSFNHQGRSFIQTGRFGLENEELYRPNGLAFYTSDKSSYEYMLVSDSYRGTISIFNKGHQTGLLSDDNGQLLKFSAPVGLTVWKNKLYVADAGNNRIEIFQLQVNSDKQSKSLPERSSSASQKDCNTCHLAWSPDYTGNEGEQDGVPPVATKRMCYSCHHGAILDSRHAIGQGEQHPDIHHPQSNTKTQDSKEDLPEKFPLADSHKKLRGQNGQLSCGTCHTPHTQDHDESDTLYPQHENPWLRVPNHGGDLCEKCHELKLDRVQNKKPSGVNHPVGTYLKKPPEPLANFYSSSKKLHEGLPKILTDNGAVLGHDQALICQSCHQVHGASNKALTVLDSDKGQLCAECHSRQYADNKKDAREKGIHPVNIDLEEAVTINGKEIKTLTCLTCHSVHEGQAGTAVLNANNKDGELCSVCHKEYERVVNSDHDLRITAKNSENRFGHNPEKVGACGSCHTMHQGEPEIPFLYAGEYQSYQGEEPALDRDRICLDCHRKKGNADKVIVDHFSHPTKEMILRSDPNTMPLINAKNEIDEFGSIACISCHDPHRWSSENKTTSKPGSTTLTSTKNQDGNVLDSFLRHTGSKGTFCVDCHGLEAQIKYKYYHDELSRDKNLDYFK